jgi:hypothetical protein
MPILSVRSKGSRSEAVRAVQKMLNALGFRGTPDPFNPQDEDEPDSSTRFRKLKVDGWFGTYTEAAVIDFQFENGLEADGIVGPITLEVLENTFAQLQIDLVGSSGPDSILMVERPGRVAITRVRADKYDQGYGRFSLRADAAEDYNKVREIVKAAGGIMTSSGGMRDLRANVGPTRSATSFHYLGRALDLFVYSLMVDPKVDPYVVERVDDPEMRRRRQYRVWARCTSPEIETRTIENAVSYDNRIEGETVDGQFLDLTALFLEHGFRSIGARRSFEAGGSQLGAESWHFQWEKGLVPGVSTFGGELLRIYSEETLEDTPPWRFRHRVFGESWMASRGEN